ncbi:MAG TPA: hypothetical protein VHX39_31950 [Acetobacteraceae bacterium]|nr:hypothetical protein [Acetobacteraceae bacterium]
MAQIPPPSDALWDRLVSGALAHRFSLFAANMALARAIRIAASEPARKPAMIAELHQFFARFPGQLAPELQGLK